MHSALSHYRFIYHSHHIDLLGPNECYILNLLHNMICHYISICFMIHMYISFIIPVITCYVSYCYWSVDDFVLIVNLLFYFKGLLWVFNTSALQKLCPFFAKPPCNMWGLVMRRTGVRTQGWCSAGRNSEADCNCCRWKVHEECNRLQR